MSKYGQSSVGPTAPPNSSQLPQALVADQIGSVAERGACLPWPGSPGAPPPDRPAPGMARVISALRERRADDFRRLWSGTCSPREARHRVKSPDFRAGIQTDALIEAGRENS